MGHRSLKNLTVLNSKYELSPVLESYYKEGTAFDNWILGFINGEGFFNLHNRGHLVFYIEHTDENSLNLIKLTSTAIAGAF